MMNCFMSSQFVSKQISDKLKKIVTDQNELKLILDLLESEGIYSPNENIQNIKKDFQLKAEQYFPFEGSDNE